MEKKVLGKGLAALIPEKISTDNIQAFELKTENVIINIPIEKIKANKYQPREEFDQELLNELASSIKEKGIIQPVLVRTNQDEYEIVAGERRIRAAKMLGYKEIPAIIKNVSDLDSLEISIIENIQREDLNPIDQAKAYKRLVDEFNMTQESVADKIGKDRVTVTNILRLLKLPAKIQEFVSHGTISMSHAKAILALTDEMEQMRLCTKIIKKGLTVRDAERYARNMAIRKSKSRPVAKDPDIMALEQELSDMFGTKVRIIESKRTGRVEIEFYSDADLERIVTLLKSKR